MIMKKIVGLALLGVLSLGLVARPSLPAVTAAGMAAGAVAGMAAGTVAGMVAAAMDGVVAAGTAGGAPGGDRRPSRRLGDRVDHGPPSRIPAPVYPEPFTWPRADLLPPDSGVTAPVRRDVCYPTGCYRLVRRRRERGLPMGGEPNPAAVPRAAGTPYR